MGARGSSRAPAPSRSRSSGAGRAPRRSARLREAPRGWRRDWRGPVEGLGAMASAFMALARRRRSSRLVISNGSAIDQDRAHQMARLALAAGRETMDVRHLGPRERGRHRADASAAHARRSPSPTSITRPPPERDQGRVRDAVDDRRRGVGNLAGLDLMDGARALRELEGRAPRAPGAWSGARTAPRRCRRGSRSSRQAPRPEDDRPLGVMPGEVALCHPRARGGIRTRSLCLTRALLHQLSYPGSS